MPFFLAHKPQKRSYFINLFVCHYIFACFLFSSHIFFIIYVLDYKLFLNQMNVKASWQDCLIKLYWMCVFCWTSEWLLLSGCRKEQGICLLNHDEICFLIDGADIVQVKSNNSLEGIFRIWKPFFWTHSGLFVYFSFTRYSNEVYTEKSCKFPQDSIKNNGKTSLNASLHWSPRCFFPKTYFIYCLLPQAPRTHKHTRNRNWYEKK